MSSPFMAHNCVDWSTRPPTRKTPLLVLSRGDVHVYTLVPHELKTLEEIATREFDLGDLDVHFLSPCANLCHDQPARITADAWEHIRPFIGCATVEVSRPRQAPEIAHTRGKRKAPPDADDKEHGNERALGARLDREAVRDDQTMSDHGSDRPGASLLGDSDRQEEPWEEDVSVFPPPRARARRRLASEDEDEGDASEQDHTAPATSPTFPGSPVASPPKPTQQSNEIKKEKQSDHHHAQLESQLGEPSHRPSRPIKQEKRDSGSETQTPHAESQHDTRSQSQTESGESHKLMIRVAHRPSKQESKFTTKGTTKVAKVLAGACKSFGLDANQAAMYLIVSVEDEDGDVENLFPCDKNDTIARAGAERETESRFLLKMAGEP